MTIYPHIPAKMPSVLLSHHTPTTDDPPLPAPLHKIDWSHLADEAARNADLDVLEHLPPPPEVIKIDDTNDFIYVPLVTQFIKQKPINSMSIDIPVASPSTLVTSQSIPPPARAPRMACISPPSCTSTRTRCLPGHLNGSVQRQHEANEEAAAPTVTTDAIFIQSTIYAHENRDVATCNIPGAFLQVDNHKFCLNAP